ncbi:MAG: aminotransferase class I/II-fold pyridoxal phosphate-dependent enzyme [Rhizobiaceae bacterium]|nr:aminotransferase class I/II-fold pyridoxal phosphate-dependent enzyme [Rhizobiaceae bacterium]
MPLPSNRITQISESDLEGWEVYIEALRLQREGKDVIMTSIGEHDFDPPQETIDACKHALDSGHHNYTDIPGKPDLREAMARVSQKALKLDIKPSEVIAMPGGQSCLYAAMQATLDPGDHIIVIGPHYVTYPGTIRAAGATFTVVDAYSEDGFQPKAEAIEAAIQDNTRAILLNTPNNPTCAIYSRETLEAIAEVCVRHDLWIISDEVYWSLSNGKHISPMAIDGMRDRTLALLSMSKSHGLTGWRVGWIVSTEAMSYNFSQHNLVSNYGMCDFISKAAQQALDGDFGLNEIAETYRNRGTVFLEALGDTNDIRVLNEPGSMYFMLDIRAKTNNTQGFAFKLLQDELVAVMPGESFGPSAAGHIRISLGESEERLKEAASRLRRFASNYTE